MNTVPHQKEMYLPNFQESKPITMEYIHKRDLILLWISLLIFFLFCFRVCLRVTVLRNKCQYKLCKPHPYFKDGPAYFVKEGVSGSADTLSEITKHYHTATPRARPAPALLALPSLGAQWDVLLVLVGGWTGQTGGRGASTAVLWNVDILFCDVSLEWCIFFYIDVHSFCVSCKI